MRTFLFMILVGALASSACSKGEETAASGASMSADGEPFGFWSSEPPTRLKSGNMAYGISTDVEMNFLSVTCAAGRPLTLILSIDNAPIRFNEDENYDLEVSYDGERSVANGVGLGTKKSRLRLESPVLEKLSDIGRFKIYFDGKQLASFDMRTFDREFDKMRSHCGM